MDLSLLSSTHNPFTGVIAHAGASQDGGDMAADVQQALFPAGFDIPTSLKVSTTENGTAGQ
jgi:hypothetical protein